MITLSRYNKLEAVWDGIKQNETIPDEIRIETEQKLLRNKLEVNVDFCDYRVEEKELEHRLTEYYATIALVNPLVKDASLRLQQDVKLIVTDPNGIIISCQTEDVIGYRCPAADLINSNYKLKNVVDMGNIVEVHYDNGLCSQLVPVFNEQGKIQFFCGVSDYRPITIETSNILCLVAQLVQQRYQNITMIDEYISSFLNAIPECVMILDENGRINDINQLCLELLKLNEKCALKGMHISKLMSIDNLHAILREEHQVQFPLRIWGEDIPCQMIHRQSIMGPYENQVVLIFNHINKIRTQVSYPLADALSDTSSSFDKIIGNAPEMNRIKSVAKRSAKSSATVLIEGESGTGKELFAEAIHQESQRPGRFIAINCGGIPTELVQSELFGYEEGAFTGAKKRGCPGKFEMANGGTVFLDEIGEMPVDIQVSLLRFLQNKTITRVGGNISKKVDVRIIAATNRDLKKEISRGNFREDLYYRLNVINIQIPSLRNRRQDVPLIANYLLKRLCEQEGVSEIKISQQTMESLLNYHWPGNARELENVIERAFILRQDEELAFDHLPITFSTDEASNKQEIEASMNKVAKEAIENTLKVNHGNISQTARVLGITRQTLYRKMKALNIER